MTTRRRWCSNKPSVRGRVYIGIAGCDGVCGGGAARCMRNEGVYYIIYITGWVGLPCGEPT